MNELEGRNPTSDAESDVGAVPGAGLVHDEEDGRRPLLDLPPTAHARMRDRNVASSFPCKRCASFLGHELVLYSLVAEEWGIRALYRCSDSEHQRCEDRPGMVCVIGFDENRVYLSDTMVANRLPLPLPFLDD